MSGLLNPGGGAQSTVFQPVEITVVNGAAAGTFNPPAGAVLIDLKVGKSGAPIGGTPDALNLRFGSEANGEQYLSDTDVKDASADNDVVFGLFGAGLNVHAVAFIDPVASTVHFTVAAVNGTTASIDGTLVANFLWGVP